MKLLSKLLTNIILGAITAFFAMLLFNYFSAEFFKSAIILTFWQTWGLKILANLFFKRVDTSLD